MGQCLAPRLKFAWISLDLICQIPLYRATIVDPHLYRGLAHGGLTLIGALCVSRDTIYYFFFDN